MDKSWDHMTVIQIIVVMGTKYIGGDDTGKVTSILFMICPAAVHKRLIELPQTIYKRHTVCFVFDRLHGTYIV